MEILRLHPLSQAEIERTQPQFLNVLFSASFKTRKWERLHTGLAERIASGGYPAAIARESQRRRAAWYRDYVDTLVQRDVRDLARVSALQALPRLLQFAAAQT